MTARRMKSKTRIVSSEPGSLRAWAVRFLEAQRVRNFSEMTVSAREYQLDVFFTWTEARDVKRPNEVTRPSSPAISWLTPPASTRAAPIAM